MIGLLNWLAEPYAGSILLLIFGCVIFKLAYSVTALMIVSEIFRLKPREQKVEFNWKFMAWLPFLALTEELIFRFFPLSFTVGIFGRSEWVLLTALLSSIAFGLVHGNIGNVFIQGGGGIVYCVVFLKCGGFQGDPGKALAICATIHFAYDAAALTIGHAFSRAKKNREAVQETKGDSGAE